jgi:flap endonuclease-1
MATQVTSEHNEDCKKLLQLMGVPIIVAPSEAEAQCAVMAKAGLVYGAATEDMDCLTFGCPRLIRHLMASQVRPSVFDILNAQRSPVKSSHAQLC